MYVNDSSEKEKVFFYFIWLIGPCCGERKTKWEREPCSGSVVPHPETQIKASIQACISAWCPYDMSVECLSLATRRWQHAYSDLKHFNLNWVIYLFSKSLCNAVVWGNTVKITRINNDSCILAAYFSCKLTIEHNSKAESHITFYLLYINDGGFQVHLDARRCRIQLVLYCTWVHGTFSLI